MTVTASAVTHGRRSALVVVAGALCFSTISIVTVLATRDGTPVSLLVVGRYGIAALLLAALARRGGAATVSRRVAVTLTVLGGIGQWLVAMLSLSALAYIPAATLVFLMYTFPLWVAVVSRVRGLEALTRPRIAARAIALAGIGMMVGMPGRGRSIRRGARSDSGRRCTRRCSAPSSWTSP